MTRAGARSAPIMIRNSERQSFKRCRFQWYLNFVRLLKPTEEQKALRFGDIFHQALAIHYKPGLKRGPKPWIAFKRVYEKQLADGMDRFSMRGDEENWLDALELGTDMLKGYYEEYHEKDEEWKVLAREQVFQVPMKVFVPGVGTRKIVVVGTMDGVWQRRRGGKEVIIKEYKTTGSSIQDVLRGLPMDEQAGTYWTFGPSWCWEKGILPQGVYPAYIWYSICRKSMKDTRPENARGEKLNKPTAKQAKAGLPGDVSKKQPAPRFDRQPVYRDAAEREIMTQRVRDEAVEMINAREGRMAILKNPGPLFMSNCRSCSFRDPCELHETGSDFESMLRGLYGDWKPYSAHELPERW